MRVRACLRGCVRACVVFARARARVCVCARAFRMVRVRRSPMHANKDSGCDKMPGSAKNLAASKKASGSDDS